MRNAATRPMLTSSTEGAAQPRITSTSSVGANGWRTSSAFRGRGEIARRERARPVARFQERRAHALDDVDVFVHYALDSMASHIAISWGEGQIW